MTGTLHRTLLLAALVGIAAPGCVKLPDSATYACTSDGDCPPGEACGANVCRVASPDAGCSIACGSRCCAGGEACNDGECVAVCNARPCLPGQVCANPTTGASSGFGVLCTCVLPDGFEDPCLGRAMRCDRTNHVCTDQAGTDAGTGPAPDAGALADDAGVVLDNCAPRARFAYVLDDSGTVSSFDPVNTRFVPIHAPLACAAVPTHKPFSLTMDHDAYLWVLYTSGELFKVESIPNGTCSPVEIHADTKSRMKIFTMAFVARGQPAVESLFLAGGTATYQPPFTLASATVGPPLAATSVLKDDLGLFPLLAGDRNNHLWSFSPYSAFPRFADIKPEDGSVPSEQSEPEITGTISEAAFTHWGGYQFVFVKYEGEPSSRLYRRDPATGDVVERPMPAGTNFTIVAAGSSTCAPTSWPNP